MSRILMRCRDAEMIGPVCDYFTDTVPFDEAVREMRVHAMTHNEPVVSNDDVLELEDIVCKQSAISR